MPDLPEKDLRKRLRYYTEEPDPDLWERIRSGLPAAKDPIAEKLARYEEEPDSGVWTAVYHLLQTERNIRRWMWSDRLGFVTVCLLFLLAIYNQETVRPVTEPARISRVEKKVQEPAGGKDTLSPNPVMDAGKEKNETKPPYPPSLPAVKQVRVTPPEYSEDLAVEGNKTVAVAHPQKDEENFKTTPDPETDALVTNALISALDSADTVPDEKDQKVYSSAIYVVLMPTLGFQQIDPVRDDGIFIESIKRLSAFSPRRLGIRAEIGWEKKLNKHLALNAGVLYFQRKQTISYYYYDSREIELTDASSEFIAFRAQPVKQLRTFEYEVKNVGLFAGINYAIQGRKLMQNIGAGTEFHRRVGTTNETFSQEYFWFAHVYYRIAYRLSDRFDLVLQPTLNYSLQVSDRIQAPFYVRPYGFGVNTGVFLKL